MNKNKSIEEMQNSQYNKKIKNGRLWYDNYIGYNNYYMGEYIWYIINIKEWTIYLLWYCREEERENNDIIKCVYIRKGNEIIHSGIIKNINGFKVINNIFNKITMDYKWEVRKIDSSQIVEEGSSPDRIIASSQVEKRLIYLYFVEPEYEMSKGCRCGCCEDPTGKWKVWNRDDTINRSTDDLLCN